MKNNAHVAAVLGLSGLLSACGLVSNNSEHPTEPSSSSAGLGGLGGYGNESGQRDDGGDDTGTPGAGGTIGDACVPGVAVTSQIPRLLNRQYDAVMRDLLGVTTLASADNQKPSDLLVEDFDGPMISPAWRAYQDTAATIAHEVMTGANKSRFISCDPATEGCLEQTIKTFGRKAFRRPLSDAEVSRFQQLGQTDPAPTADELAEATLTAFLVSPSFLLLPELAPDPSGSTTSIRLSSYELATRLSILIWGSIPDDQLAAAADQNQLQTKDQILAQAQRMIVVREKSAPILAAFHRFWTQMDNASGHWWKTRHDTSEFPLYSDAAAASLKSELDAFFDDLAFRNGTFKDYFSSNVAFVNQDSAAIYGLDPARYGADLKRVELDATQRAGFLTRAGFLSSYSNYGNSSPFLRGAYIAQSFLGEDFGAERPSIDLETIPGVFKTNRELTEAITQYDSCKPCHSLINPLGDALENFDAIGKWQTVDQLSGAIDATVTVNINGSSKQISSPAQLMQEIANAPSAQRLYAQSWVSFAFGRSENANDSCTVDELSQKVGASGYTVLNLFADLSQADSFRLRSQGPP